MRKLLLLFWALLLLQAAEAQPTSYRLDKMLGTPIGGPRDVAVDSRGFIYVADGVVNKLDSTGRFVAAFSPGPTIGATAVALDAADNVCVANYGSTSPDDIVRKYSPSGQLLLHFGTSGYGAGQIANVVGMCVGPTGTIYLADGYTNRLLAYDSQGQFLFETAIANPNYNAEVKDVNVDAAGNVYVLQNTAILTKLSATGQFLSRIPLGNATGSSITYGWAEVMTLDLDGNFVVSASQGGITHFSPTGVALGSALQSSSSGMSSSVAYGISSSTHTALAYDRAGNLYATVFTHQIFQDHLFKFSPTGALLKRWGNLAALANVRQDEVGNVYTWDNSTVRKYNAAGQQVLTFSAGNFGLYAAGMALDGVGNIYLLNTSDLSSSVQKFSPLGKPLATFTDFGTGTGYQRFSGLAVDVGGYMYLADYLNSCVRKLSPQGIFMNTIGQRGQGAGQLLVPRAVAVDLAGNVYAADFDGRRVQKFSPSGRVLQQYGPSSGNNTSVSVGDVDLDVDGRGRVYVATFVNAGKIFSADGSTETALPAFGTRVSVNRQATRILTMNAGSDLVKFFVSAQQPPQSLISGQIFHDPNRNCVQDAGELPLPGVAVVAEPGAHYGMTDENGNYTIAVDTGSYTVRQILPTYGLGRTLEQSCARRPVVALPDYSSSATGVDFGDQVSFSTAPYLRLGVASSRRRRCFRNTTTVSYVNNGFGPAANATVTVALPPQVIFISANFPHMRDAAGNYVFAVGTVQPNQMGSIVLQDSVVCGDPSLRGLTVCTKAWITPGNPYPVPSAWNQASVVVQGSQQTTNQARFVLRNTGTGNMTDSLALRIYQNTDLALQHRYALAAGDSLVLRISATRPVVRVEADEPAGHPLRRVASAAVELRGLSAPGAVSAALAALPPNAPPPEMAEDCQPILDSYDPNDKQVWPVGVGSQRYTPTGVPLHYKVRFQNTGSDDAYRVEVVDTLAAELDLATLRVEAASHPYRLRLAGNGRPVLTFTFDGIGLPPSTRDAAGSNGFVQFSIQPKAGLPAKALVENYADIFFDYNLPVRTNTTTNRLYDLPPTVAAAVALNYPEVVASPTIGQLTPAQGRTGTLVTITGQRFAASAVANRVLFNWVATPVLSATPTSLTVRVPPASTTGTVVVATPDGAARSSQAFTVYQPPVLAAFSPTEGVVGSSITLTGQHFSPLAAQDTVWIGAVPALVQQATATTLQLVVPAGATTGTIKLQTLGGQVESAQPLVVWYPPTLLRFSPARGKAGDLLTLTGSNYAPAPRSLVFIGGQAATVVQATATSLQVRVPTGAHTGRIRVQAPGGEVSSATDFTFLPAPIITSFVPQQGTVGETVVLTGTNFLLDGQPDTVSVGSLRAPVLAATATTATIRVPRGAQTGLLTMRGVGGVGQSAAPFTVLELSPAEAITVYPNPAHGAVTLDWLRADFTLEHLQVYNALGMLVASTDLRAQATTSLLLPLRPGQSGLFLLVIQTSRGPVTKRLTIY